MEKIFADVILPKLCYFFIIQSYSHLLLAIVGYFILGYFHNSNFLGYFTLKYFLLFKIIS